MYCRLSQWYDQHVVTPKTRYRLTNSFNAISSPINALAFLDDHFLASAGDDQAVCIWDIKNNSLYQKLDDGADRWGQITTLVSTTTAGSALRFICGTGRSQIVSFRQSSAKGDFEEMDCIKAFEGGNFVETLAFDVENLRLAVSSHHGDLSVYQLDNIAGTLTKRWTQHLGAIIPRAIHFMDKGQNLTVYSLHNGEVIFIDVETSVLAETMSLQTRIGNLNYHHTKNMILVDNMNSGFDVYPIGRSAPSKRFMVPRDDKYVLMAKFAEDAGFVVTGSDHGSVHIFRFGTTEELQVLYHGGRKTMIQTIATTTTSVGEHIIASASAGDRSSICIWRKPSTQEPLPLPLNVTQDVPSSIQSSAYKLRSFLYHMAVIISAIAVWNAVSKISPSDINNRIWGTLSTAIWGTPSTAPNQVTTQDPLDHTAVKQHGQNEGDTILLKPDDRVGRIQSLQSLLHANAEELDEITEALLILKRSIRQADPGSLSLKAETTSIEQSTYTVSQSTQTSIYTVSQSTQSSDLQIT